MPRNALIFAALLVLASPMTATPAAAFADCQAYEFKNITTNLLNYPTPVPSAWYTVPDPFSGEDMVTKVWGAGPTLHSSSPVQGGWHISAVCAALAAVERCLKNDNCAPFAEEFLEDSGAVYDGSQKISITGQKDDGKLWVETITADQLVALYYPGE